MVRYSVRWSSRANKNLKEIFTYIEQYDCKEKAVYVAQHIRIAVEKAAIFPHKHPMLDNDNAIRFTVQWKFKIIFHINPNGYISVLSVFHTSQHPDKLVIKEN